MTDFDPTTNRIPCGLLTEEELAALKAWPNGWEYTDGYTPWRVIDDPRWTLDFTYRGKPAPKRIVTWHNVDAGGYTTRGWYSRGEADAYKGHLRICVYRIEHNEDGSDPQIFVEEV